MRRRNILGMSVPAHAIEGEWTRLRSRPPRQYRQIVTIPSQFVDTIEIFPISPLFPWHDTSCASGQPEKTVRNLHPTQIQTRRER